MDPEISEDESRRKRVKISDDIPSDQPAALDAPLGSGAPSTPALDTTQGSLEKAQALKEAEVGITDFVSADIPGFSGIVKKRYTDFLVNEIVPSGTVLHLNSLSVPSSLHESTQAPAPASDGQQSKSESTRPPGELQEIGNDSTPKDPDAPFDTAQTTVSDDDRKLLDEYLGTDITEKVIQLHKRALAKAKSRPSDVGKVQSSPITDREARTKLHQAVRRIFASRLETSTGDDGEIVFSAASKRGRGAPGKNQGERRKGKVGWSELGGEYLHFTLYKENKDTMEVMSFLSKQMKLNPKHFQFAGTKDRRGVTVQRASVYRVNANRLLGTNKFLRNATLGDFEYQKCRLELGELKGNEFVITLRDCQFPKEMMEGLTGPAMVSKASDLVSESLHNLYERGYFNYYGLQRFGTFATRTDTVGVKMLQEDFSGACESILRFSPESLAAAQNAEPADNDMLVGSDDKARAEAIHIFQTTGNFSGALEKMPRKFSAESGLIRHLGRNKNDYVGALQTIPRNLRLMYVHAYQSYVWNFAVGERWRLYGDKVVAGDLVLAHEFKGTGNDPSAADEVDADGEVIVLPDPGDSASSVDDKFVRARALTAAEAASGTYSIFDIVLPLPGFDVIYPPNAMTDFYKEFMSSDRGGNLDPFDMRRKWKDVSLSGSYRKVLSRPGAEFSFEVKAYTNDDEQFVVTDLEKLKNSANTKADCDGPKAGETDQLAVIIKLQLGSSQYATMALRELMKSGGAKMYKPEFSSRR